MYTPRAAKLANEIKVLEEELKEIEKYGKRRRRRDALIFGTGALLIALAIALRLPVLIILEFPLFGIYLYLNHQDVIKNPHRARLDTKVQIVQKRHELEIETYEESGY